MPRTKLELARIENERKRLEAELHKRGMDQSISIRAIEPIGRGPVGVKRVFRGEMPLVDAEDFIFQYKWEPAAFILKGGVEHL